MDTIADRIVINVGGKRHETHASTLQTIPDTRLAWIAESFLANDNRQEIFFDRNPELFGIILNYYRTGQLHAPRDFCGPLFEAELIFWGIEEREMEACCWPYYTQHRDAEKNLKDFVGPEFEDTDNDDEEFSPDLESSSFHQVSSLSYWTLYKPKIWAVIDDPHSSTKAKVFALFSLFMILASVASLCASSVVIENEYVLGFEYLFCAWFTLEFIARFIFCPDKIVFFKQIMTWVDLMSLLPFYSKLFFKTDLLNFLRAVRLIRVFRALKAFAFTSGLQIIVQSLKASFRELILLLIILLIPVVVFSSIVYDIENNVPSQPHFRNIPETFWWAIITMTTVGYGDMVPKTILGRVIGGICAIFGVLIVALPVSVIGNNFSTYYTHAQARLSLPRKKRRLICAANLRMNVLPEQSAPSSTSLKQNGGLQETSEGIQLDASPGSAKRFRRYHRRSRNTLFAHGDVYIGPSKLERQKLSRSSTCKEEENENETENETKSESATTKETISSGELDNKPDKVHDLSGTDSEILPAISSLPRNFTLINSTHESEEITEEAETRPASVLSEHRNGVIKKRNKTANLPVSHRKKSNSSPNKWLELKNEQSPTESRRPQSSRARKARVSPAEVLESYQNHVEGSTQNLSPRHYPVPSFKLDMENSQTDKPALVKMPEQKSNKTANSTNFTETLHRPRTATLDADVTNGYAI